MPHAEAPFSQAFLQAHGIHASPEAFLRTVRHAVERLPQITIPDPRTELSPEEIETLREGGFDVAPRNLEENDPVARTAADLAVLVESSMSVTETAKRLGVDRSRILQRLTTERTLFGFRWEKRWLVPVFQFEGDQCLPHLGEIIRALPKEIHPLAVHQWFCSPDPDLEDEETDRVLSPREWLLLGRPRDLLVHNARHLR